MTSGQRGLTPSTTTQVRPSRKRRTHPPRPMVMGRVPRPPCRPCGNRTAWRFQAQKPVGRDTDQNHSGKTAAEGGIVGAGFMPGDERKPEDLVSNERRYRGDRPCAVGPVFSNMIRKERTITGFLYAHTPPPRLSKTARSSVAPGDNDGALKRIWFYLRSGSGRRPLAAESVSPWPDRGIAVDSCQQTSGRNLRRGRLRESHPRERR